MKNYSRILLFSSTFLFQLNSQSSTWSDTYLGYKFGTTYREPYNKENIVKNIVSLNHVSGYKYGSNFFSVNMLSSNRSDPASGGASGGGAHEVYVVYRTTLSLDTFGLSVKNDYLRDLSLTAGFDYNAKNDQFSSRVTKYFLGPKVSFNVPNQGFFDVAVGLKTENNHNWYATNGSFGSAGCSGATCHPDINFKPTYTLETAWKVPFEAGIDMEFKGFANYTGPKGDTATGSATKAETLLEAALMLDIGSLMDQSKTFYVGPGFQFWNNKFGNDASNDSTGGSKATVAQLAAEIHF